MSSSTASAASTAVGAAIDVDADGNEEENALPPIQSIWEDEYCNKSGNGESFQCKWCGFETRPPHAKQAKAHVAKIPGQGIQTCPASIPDNYLQRYRNLWDRDNAKTQASVNIRKRKEQLVEERQVSARCKHAFNFEVCYSNSLSRQHSLLVESNSKPYHQAIWLYQA